MNAATLENSDRLQRVHKLLSGGGEHTTLEIIQKAGVCAVNSIISELRQQGLDIQCERRADKWYYRMNKND